MPYHQILETWKLSNQEKGRIRELFVFLLYIIGIHVKKTVGDFKKKAVQIIVFYFLLFILFFQNT